MKKILTVLFLVFVAVGTWATDGKWVIFNLTSDFIADGTKVLYNTESCTITSTVAYDGYIQNWCESSNYQASKLVVTTKDNAGLKIIVYYQDGTDTSIDQEGTSTFEISLDPTKKLKNILMQTKAVESTGIVLTSVYLTLGNVTSLDLTKYSSTDTSQLTFNTSTLTMVCSTTNWPALQDWSEISGKYATKMVVNFDGNAEDVQLSVYYTDSESDNKVEERVYNKPQVVATLDPTKSIHHVKIIPAKAETVILKEAYLVPVYLSEATTPSLTENSKAPVVLYRGFKSGWNTICLPFATTATAIATGAEVYTYTSATKDAVTLTKVDGGAMTAGTPYMLKMSSAQSSPITFSDVTISATTAGATSEINGLTFKGNYSAGMAMADKYGLVNDGSSSSIKKGSGENAKLPAFAAYFDGTKPNSAPSRGFSIEVGDGTTGIDAMERVVEEDNSPTYNLMGQQTTTPRKGIYIKNGKKYIAK